MKKFVLVLLAVILLSGCVSQMKYTPPVIPKPEKIPAYVPPDDPTAKLEPPKPVFLKRDPKDPNKWVPCDKAEGILIAYYPVEHDKIVLRLQYLKEMNTSLVKLVNVYIDINNIRVELQLDQQLAKEVYKQMWIDSENRLANDKLMNDLEKGGLAAVIVGQLMAIMALAF
jgi:hypothetical protein